MRQLEFDAHRWSRVKNDELLTECVVTSRRAGWVHAGYEVRLYLKSQLIYRSPLYLTRKLANDEADALLRDTLFSVARNGYADDRNGQPLRRVKSNDEALERASNN